MGNYWFRKMQDSVPERRSKSEAGINTLSNRKAFSSINLIETNFLAIFSWY